MRKTLILSLCLALLCGLALGGCGSETPKKDLQYNTAYPLGTAEYQMTVNQKLAPLISSLQPLANAEAFNNTADASDKDFSVILKSIEEAFRVSVN